MQEFTDKIFAIKKKTEITVLEDNNENEEIDLSSQVVTALKKKLS